MSFILYPYVPRLSHVRLLLAGNPQLDPNIVYVVHYCPSHFITVGMDVIVILTGFAHIEPIVARIGHIDSIYRGYVIFNVQNCHYDIQRITLPLCWVRLSQLDCLTFWHQLEQSQIDPLPVYHLTPAELLSPFPTTERVIRDVLSDEESVVEGTVVAQAPLGRGWRETLLD